MPETILSMADDVKKIQIETKFADAMWRDFRSKKFGISSCCLTDDDSIIRKKHLCDWQDLENKVLTPSTGLTIQIIDCETGLPVPPEEA